MLAADVALLILVVALLIVAYAGFHRLTNSRGSVTWDIRTVEPDSSTLRVERDEARREAERLRDEMRRADTLPPSAE